MARQQFPSDSRRWFRVIEEEILDDPKLSDELPADCFRFYIRLLAMLNRTKSRDGQISLGRRALSLCAGREQARHALRVACAGAEAGLYRLSVEGAQTLITVPNYAEKQGFTPTQLQRDSDETPATKTKTKTTPKTKRVSGRKRPSKPTPSGESVLISERLAQHVRTRLPGAPIPTNLDAWAQEVSKIEADPGVIEAAVDWLYSPANEGRFRLVVQSGKALREKFGKILAAMERERARKSGGSLNIVQNVVEKLTAEDLDEQAEREINPAPSSRNAIRAFSGPRGWREQH